MSATINERLASGIVSGLSVSLPLTIMGVLANLGRLPIDGSDSGDTYNGPYLDLSFCGLGEDLATGVSLDLNFTGQTYQVATTYASWE